MAPNQQGNHESIYIVSSPRPKSKAHLETPLSPAPPPAKDTRRLPSSNLILLGLAQLLGGFAFSLLSPFYTEEATQKGLSVTQTGLVYGSVFLTTIAFSPLFGKYIEYLGARRLFLYGTFLAGSTNILFGMLQWVEEASSFLILSLSIRIVSAIGEAAFFSSVIPLVTRDAPVAKRSSILSVMETMFGFGLMIGPFLGGLLYEIGGFYFPFVICGSQLVLCAFLSALLLTNKGQPVGQVSESATTDPRTDATSPPTTHYWQLLKMPTISISCFLLIVSETSVTWYLPTLQPMLQEKFNLRPVTTGAMFMVEGATYALFSPLWGFLLDKNMGAHFALGLGASGVIVGYCLLGPAPFLPFIPDSVYTIVAGLIIQGLGVAATFITTLVFMMKESIAHGAADTEQTRGMVTSLWFISENVAGYVGSAVGGLTYDTMGFDNSTLIVIALQGLALLAITVLYCSSDRIQTREKETLLSSQLSKKEDMNANYRTMV